MTAEAVCRKASHFGFLLLGEGFALGAKQHYVSAVSANEKEVSWCRAVGGPIYINNPSTINDYLNILERGDYSFIMSDGGVVQLSYSFSGNVISKHRLAYVPCPFDVLGQLPDAYDGGIVDYIREVCLEDVAEKVLLQSVVRFDFDPPRAGPMHPASHMTFNRSECRIPLRSSLCFGSFMRFIFEHFYPTILSNDRIARELTTEGGTNHLSEEDMRRLHVYWGR